MWPPKMLKELVFRNSGSSGFGFSWETVVHGGAAAPPPLAMATFVMIKMEKFAMTPLL